MASVSLAVFAPKDFYQMDRIICIVMVHDNTRTGTTDRTNISRRKLLLAAGAAGIGGLAGCSQGGNGGNGGSGGKGRVDPILDEAQDTGLPPKDFNWNPFAAESFNGNVGGWVFEWGSVLFQEDGKLRPWGYKSWSYDEKQNVFTTKVRDDLKQWNGNAFTAEDVYAYDELFRLQSPESSQYKHIELVDDSTINYHLKKPINPNIYANYNLVTTFYEGKDTWQPWIERYRDATTQQAREKVTKDLKQFTISNKEFMEKGLGTGVFQLQEVSDVSATLKRWDDHRNADNVPIDTLRIRFAATQGRYGQLLTQDKSDIGRAPFPEQYKGPAPDYLQNLATYPTLNNIKMLINWRNKKYLQDVNFRRAMAAVINTKPIAQAAGNGKPIPIQSGMDPSFNEQFVGSDIDQYISYSPTKSDYKLADKFLKRSGYSRQNGTVVGPDGGKLEPMRFVVGNQGQWHIAGRFVSEQLKKYGFPIKYRSIKRSRKVDIVYKDETMDEWDLSTESHYAGTTLHPFSYFDYRTFWGWRLGPAQYSADANLNAKVREWLKQGKEYSPYNGKPLTPKVPTKIGQQDLSGKTKELNIYELINEIQTPISEQRGKEIIQDLSWAWNFHLPDIDTYILLGGMWGDTKHFKWSDKKWPYTGVNNAGVYYSVKQGFVDYKNKNK
jgi:peptide/nickel transport system substrate-binding protein